MTASGNGSQRFTVHCSKAVEETIRRLHDHARKGGRGRFVTQALRKVIRALETHPLTVGEPAYRLPALRLQVRTVVVRPLLVDYAVHEDRPLVMIKGVKLLPFVGS
jgi:hypothetical protein